MSQDKEGWVYCISNDNVRSAKLPNNILLKIGMTERTPQERLAEANRSDTWRPPVNYKIEFAKKVKNALQKEKTIHKLLEQYNERVNRSREFFDISVEKARLYFDLMDGEYLELEPKEEPKATEDLKPKKQKGGRKKKEEMPKPEVKQEEKLKYNLKPYQINLDNLSEEESEKILKEALEKEALELKLNNKYYHFQDIINGKLSGKLDSTMTFSAIIKCVDSPDTTILPSNINKMIEKLKITAPSTFLLVEEIQNELINPKQELENNPAKLELLLNINIKDLTYEESNTLLKTAFNLEALHIKIGKKYNRFYELINIKPTKLKNTVFEARIVEAPDDTISSIDEDCAFYISKVNYKSIMKTLKDTSKTQIIILTELCKL